MNSPIVNRSGQSQPPTAPRIVVDSSVEHLRRTAMSILARTSLKDMDASQLVQLLRYDAVAKGLDEDTISAAIDMACVLHFNQLRGNRGNFSKTPYIEHPLRNAIRLLRFGVVDQDIIVAAVLHDVIEDGAILFVNTFYEMTQPEQTARESLSAYILGAFGGRVLELVEAVTNDYIAEEDKANQSLKEKSDAYRSHVSKSINRDPGVLLVKLSDFIDNATGLYHNDVPGNEKKTMNRAVKYLPIVQVFKDAIQAHGDKLEVPEKQVTCMIEKLDLTFERLHSIIARHASL